MRAKDPMFKTKAVMPRFLINVILNYEEEQNKISILNEEKAYVGKNVADAELELQRKLQQARNAIKVLDDKIEKVDTALNALNTDHDAFLREIEEDEMKRNKIENERRLLANDALNTFNRLNQGRVQIQREPQETDAELLARIARLGTIQADPSDIENQILEKAKKNILQLTSDTTKAEMTLKSLSSDEQHMMNKIFPKIKKNFTETFG